MLRLSTACVPQILFGGKEGDTEYCLTPECVRAARKYNTSINTYINPCDDFYEFVCAGWKRANRVPPKMSSWSHFNAQYFQVLTQLHQSLEYIHEPSTEAETKVINFYKSCMREVQRENVGVKPLKRILEIIGGWPLLGGPFREENYNWLESLIWISTNIGHLPIIFNVFVAPNELDARSFILHFDQSSLGFEIDKLCQSQDGFLDIYNNEILRSVNEFNSSRGNLTAKMKDITDMVKFEAEMARILKLNEYSSEIHAFHKTTVGSLQNLFGDINFTSYMENTLRDFTDITDDTEIMRPESSYITMLAELLAKTNRRVIANYIGWRLVKTFASLTIRSFRDNRLQLISLPIGSEVGKPLYEQCVTLTNKYFDYGLGSIYVKDHFKDEYVDDLIEMVNFIRNAFDGILKESDWMDTKTKEEAIRKLQLMKLVIGYPNWILNDKKLNDYYKNLYDIKVDNFFENVIKIFQFQRNNNFKQLTQRFDRNKDWVKNPVQVNAYYEETANGIFLSAALTQFPYYQFGLPKYIHFGAFGNVIGHEMTHGFDNLGSKYDQIGNKRDWWSPHAKKNFQDKAACFVKQYGNYQPLEGININGSRTLGENIADNGGIRESFRAWKRYVMKHGDYNNKKLPNLNFTKEQLFFIAYAYVWCSNEYEESQVKMIRTNEHSPKKYRVLGALSNNRDFHKAFNCTKGNKMYREDRCLLW